MPAGILQETQTITEKRLNHKLNKWPFASFSRNLFSASNLLRLVDNVIRVSNTKFKANSQLIVLLEWEKPELNA